MLWLDRREELRPAPSDAVWPRLMTAPHPRAAGSYGPAMLAWAAERLGMHPKRTTGHRWWQELVAYRMLEHDEDGHLLWSTVILSTARQVGKSWLLRELALYRMSLAERLGEMQTVIHAASKLPQAYGVWRPASRWARHRGYDVRLTNGEQAITAENGSQWLIQAANDDLGVSYSVGLGIVDEAWNVPREVFENGLEPTGAEAAESQMLLVSTAGVPRVGAASDLMPTYRAQGIREMVNPGSLLMIEWSADPDADRDDPATWRHASPMWTPQREALIREKHRKAITPGTVTAFDLQWLNRWPAIKTASELALVDPDLWAQLRTLEPTTWETVAVEAAFGSPPVVAFAGHVGERIVVAVQQAASMDDAARIVTEAAIASQPIVGKSLLHDPVWANLAPVAKGETAAAALGEFRAMVDERVLAHYGSPELTDQVTGTDVIRSLAGIRIVSAGRVDAIKAASWAAVAARSYQPWFTF